ncbi:hypothetical protein LTR86_002560 [Recurvomyces mirabilis]|nr:hypothetical protein LTR86_002560 [Recurvomyces mirabilis]
MAAQDMEVLDRAVQSLTLGTTSTTGGTKALEALAQSSRTDLESRARLAQPEILRNLITVIDSGLDHSVEVAELGLRCIGNACIDNDDAQTTVTQSGFTWASRCLASEDTDLAWLTVKVLYNICSDHDGAQQQCYQDYIHYPLIRLYTNIDSAREEDRSLLIDLLFWVSGQRDAVLEGTPDLIRYEILVDLVSLSSLHGSILETEDLATLLEITLTFFRDSAVQDQIVECGLVKSVWQEFISCEKRSQQSSEAHEVLRPLSSSLLWCLSDIAAKENFSQHYNMQNDLIMHLCNTISTGRTGADGSAGAPSSTEQRAEHISDRSIAAACQVIGNLIRKLDENIVAELVTKRKLHEGLWQRIITPEDDSDHDIEHSIAGLLVQLSRPSAEVRDTIGRDTNAHDALARLCQSQTPQVKQDGIRLLRALGKDCSSNQERFGRLAAEAMMDDSQHDAPMQDAPA